MVRKIFFLILIITLGNACTLKSEPLSTNRLAIILDESEGMGNFEGAMLRTAFALFIQKSTPFIISSALWDWIVLQGHIARDIKTLSKKDFATKYPALRTLITDDFDLGLHALKLTQNTLEAYKTTDFLRLKRYHTL